MPWVRLDDGYPEHPKVDQVGPLAAWLNVCAWAYCARNLTDGFVPADRVGRLASVKQPDKLCQKLVAARLWECVEGGFQVHDYLAYNPSREEILRERTRAAERMRSARSSPEHRPKFAESSPNPVPIPSQRDGNDVKAPGPSAREPGPGGPLALTVGPEYEPTHLPNGAHQCPLCPEIYTGTYGEHLEQSPRHKVREQPEDFGRSRKRKKSAEKVSESDKTFERELAAVGERKSVTVEDLPETLRAEHERLRAKERSQADGG